MAISAASTESLYFSTRTRGVAAVASRSATVNAWRRSANSLASTTLPPSSTVPWMRASHAVMRSRKAAAAATLLSASSAAAFTAAASSSFSASAAVRASARARWASNAARAGPTVGGP